MATLHWRKDCAEFVLDLLLAKPVRLEEFKSCLLSNYDEYVTQWILQDFLGIRLIPDSTSYLVTINDTPSEE